MGLYFTVYIIIEQALGFYLNEDIIHNEIRR